MPVDFDIDDEVDKLHGKVSMLKQMTGKPIKISSLNVSTDTPIADARHVSRSAGAEAGTFERGLVLGYELFEI